MRTPSCDKNGLKKGTWTPEEDKKLLDYITRYGSWNWRQLPKFAGLSRCGKSCRLRWLNYLRPNIKRGNYTKEEEDTIFRLHDILGNRWSAIAAQLPGRTDNEIKNHWHTYLKKRAKPNSNDHHYPKHKSEKKKKNKKEANNKQKIHLENPTIPQTLESSTVSPKSSTTDDLSSMSRDNTAVDSNNESKSENYDFAFFEPYEEPTGNFWTEPFLADNEFMPPLLLDPLSPLLDGDVFSYGIFDQYSELQNSLNS